MSLDNVIADRGIRATLISNNRSEVDLSTGMAKSENTKVTIFVFANNIDREGRHQIKFIIKQNQATPKKNNLIQVDDEKFQIISLISAKLPGGMFFECTASGA